ncbi:unnamed protein product [Urochloa humidicola]
MAEAAAGEAAGNGEKSAGFRWLDAVRYAVAAVMTVLIIAVVANAIKVVLRPDSMTLAVLGGSVGTTRASSPPPALTFYLSLRARNPSDRVRMYFFDIVVYLFDNSTAATTTPTPLTDCFFSFNLENMTLPQMEFADRMKVSYTTRDPEVITPTAFDALYKTGGTIKDATMRVDGSFITEIRSGYNTSARNVTYYCRQLVVSLYDEASMKTQELGCTTS